MQFLGQPIPTENPQAQEGALKEEGEQALHRKGRPEDVAHEAAVGGPVHSELEFLNYSCDHPDGEIDEEEFSEEFGGP